MIAIRPAAPGDAPTVEALLAQLGYRMPASELHRRLRASSASETDAVLVATMDGRMVGLIALHWATMLHQPAPTARIATLVVADDARGRGVGRTLVEAGAEAARRAGCAILELTTALHRADAVAFYEAIGFTASSTRLHRAL
ncbi:GNAT family N-acetyltransferase [Thalassobaculum sp.]|uniref:GNAT family N-acetyltransferase n=1 Tax=Thalassobaculum sp. TaxID=2022740 RepID=UPI0032EACB02